MAIGRDPGLAHERPGRADEPRAAAAAVDIVIAISTASNGRGMAFGYRGRAPRHPVLGEPSGGSRAIGSRSRGHGHAAGKCGPGPTHEHHPAQLHRSSRIGLDINRVQGASARNAFHHSDHQLNGGSIGQALCSAEGLPSGEGGGVCDGGTHHLAVLAWMGGQESV